MTDRKPDFYRVVRVRDGVRQWWIANTGGGHFGADAPPHLYATEADADVVVDNLNEHWRGEGAYSVPVYVKVTRKPKLHDFAWALRMMREGKRVRREGWPSPLVYLYMGNRGRIFENTSAAVLEWIPLQSQIIGTDWELAP